MKVAQCSPVIYPAPPLSCSLESHRELFHLTFVSEKNAISVQRMPKVMGAIFHPARIERLMAADGEGKVFNSRGWGEEWNALR